MHTTVMLAALAVLIMLVGGLRLLSASRAVTCFASPEFLEYAVVTGATIWRGGFVGLDPSGKAKRFQPGDRFGGVADHPIIAAVAGDRIRVRQAIDLEHAISGVTAADIGKAAYATDDETLALTGHPYAFVGRIVAVNTSGIGRVRLKRVGEMPRKKGDGCIWIPVNLAELFAGVTGSSSGADGYLDGLQCRAKAAAGGPTVSQVADALKLLLANTNEAEFVTVQTGHVFNVTKGITLRIKGRLSAAGGAATDDAAFGLAALSGGITDTQRADMQATTAGLQTFLALLDANGADYNVTSDDNTTVLGPYDTGIDNDTGTDHVWDFVVRADGAGEIWCDGVRVQADKAFSVGTSGLFAAVVNIEKSTGTGVPALTISEFEAAGAA
jgi:hypothetical protein